MQRLLVCGDYDAPCILSHGSGPVVITKLNLSSTPFRNRALPWTVTGIVTVFSIVALVVIGQKTFQKNAQAQSTARDVAELRKQTDELNKKADEIRKALTHERQRDLK